MLSGLEARALCQYLGPDVRYKENFISSFLFFHFDNKLLFRVWDLFNSHKLSTSDALR